MKLLHLAPGLALPLDAVTQTFGILGKRGGGKTYTAKVMAEEMIHAGAHVCCIDPIGNWWGLRVAADGKAPGLPITVLGGDYGDIPLEASEKAGELVARLIVEEKISVVIDISRFRKGEQTSFMIGWAETLYRLNREALHLFVDEADAWAPQRPVGNLAPRLLGAMEDLVRRGRARGLGMTMITQRSASINKDLLTQIEVLIAKRTIAPQDRAAVEAWIEVHGTPAEQKTLMDSLPSLPISDAWFWAPAWLGLFKRVSVRKLETLDSSATPEVGRRRVEPRKLADVEIEKLRERMAATIEKHKASDPRELQKTVGELRAKIQKMERSAAPPVAAVDPEALKRAESVGYSKGYRAAADDMKLAVLHWNEQAADQLAALFNEVKPWMAGPNLEKAESAGYSREQKKIIDGPRLPRFDPLTSPLVARIEPPLANGNGKLGKGERKILTAVAQYPDGATREQLTVLTGYKSTSRYEYLRKLAAGGLIIVDGERLKATTAGLAELGSDFEKLPSGPALRQYWLERLPEGEKKVLMAAIDAYYGRWPADTVQIQTATGYKSTSVYEYTRKLLARRLLVQVRPGTVKVSEDLF